MMLVGADPCFRLTSIPFLPHRPGRRASTFAVVSAGKHPKRRLRSPRPAMEESFDEMSGAEEGLASFELDPRGDTSHPATTNQVALGRAPREASAVLRGSDVLLALQRAVAEKEMQKEKVRNKKKPPPRRNTGGAPAGNSDFEGVRPIEVRSEWSARIQELDQRVRDLRARYH